ncbi:MAG: RnfABCDGE type electron transport complex subunit D [Deltaproteobacteria bacterium]|nr:RnfABCDGE type electron transport complex subunit D [Deltaproteobacteria bacterium]MBW1928360.1 RnfABCDGE type electron transport complex subunit D [Deltaproteobacteria bacterium]MBW2026836.1 RnfABCDGE type electron transport complex subunit D [Deltaproteobacteria bacterium]MBW2126885.1 RnfABCDGE type electron transport complex subunit D [Deltaproteobacteria bacterium]
METPNYPFYVSFPPHVFVRKSIPTIMYNHLLALVPAVAAALYYFRIGALKVMLLAMVSAMVFEALMQKFLKRDITISDGSAALSGLLLGMLLPPNCPWWVVVIGAGSAIIIGKQIYGGLGNNPFNTTLIGWVILRLSWPDRIASWVEPFGGEIPDPPLNVFKFDGLESFLDYDFQYLKLFLGSQAGGIGTICILALLAGGLYLIIRRIISWHIPVGLLGSLFVFASILWLVNEEAYLPPLFHLLSGTAVFGAFFVATDPVTSPLRPLPKLIYGIMCGILIMIIRTWGKYPDGTAFAILLCNAAAPLLNKIRPKPYGKEEPVA